MRTIMERTSHDTSLSFSKRQFQWIIKKAGSGGKRHDEGDDDNDEEEALVFTTNSSTRRSKEYLSNVPVRAPAAPPSKKKQPGGGAPAVAISRFRAAFMSAIAAGRFHRPNGGGLGSRVTGTLFGRRRGHVHFAFQVDPRSSPVLLVELATPTSGLVREMASGLVRIALECEKKPQLGSVAEGGAKRRLLQEPLWRTYCNGKKCGYAVRRECGAADWKVLRAVEPVSMGAGVLPGPAATTGEGEEDGEIMYMRARFERVVGSRDSEAFYMMNPDGNGVPELSIYLLRV